MKEKRDKKNETFTDASLQGSTNDLSCRRNVRIQGGKQRYLPPRDSKHEAPHTGSFFTATWPGKDWVYHLKSEFLLKKKEGRKLGKG